MIDRIKKMIDMMSVEVMRTRLAEYMMQDESLKPRVTAIEVRRCGTENAKCRYEVVLVDEDGAEEVVSFGDRCSRLIYIYTLMHTKGYQRYQLAKNGGRELCRLFRMLYFKEPRMMMKSMERNFERFVSQAVAQSRVAIRNAGMGCEELEIGSPKTLGKEVIPFVANGGRVVIAKELQTESEQATNIN